MSRTRTFTISGLVLIALASTVHLGARRAETSRTLYLSATDAAGAFVSDLKAEDITVKEGGKEYPVGSLKPATEMMDISLLVEDNGTGAYQQGLLEILQVVMGHARVAMTQFLPQASKVLDYSEKFEDIQVALGKFGRRGTIQPDGEQLVEAVANAARELQKKKPARPVIVVMTLSGDSLAKNPDLVLTDLRKSGAGMNVIHLSNANIGQVLGDGPRETGGRTEKIGSVLAIPPAAKKLADGLLHQYALTYTLPDGVKMSDRVSISTTRKGTTLQAPSRVPDR